MFYPLFHCAVEASYTCGSILARLERARASGKGFRDIAAAIIGHDTGHFHTGPLVPGNGGPEVDNSTERFLLGLFSKNEIQDDSIEGLFKHAEKKTELLDPLLSMSKFQLRPFLVLMLCVGKRLVMNSMAWILSVR